jgi:hypothetical protein
VTFAKQPQLNFDPPPEVARNYDQELSISPAGNLEWIYSLPGDLDQDGRVFMDDLIVFDIYNETPGPFAQTSLLHLIDGNGDGYVASDDVTFVGIHMNQALSGFNVYAGSAADLPVGTDAPSTLAPLAYVSLADGLGDSAAERLRFSVPVDAPSGTAVWIRPLLNGVEGPASMTAMMP